MKLNKIPFKEKQRHYDYQFNQRYRQEELARRKEAQQFQDDIVCAIGTDFMQTIAESENRMIFDILSGIESEATADVAEVKHGHWDVKEFPNE